MSGIDDLATAMALWEHLPLGVLAIDATGVLRMANSRVLQMTGWDDDSEVLGRSVFEFLVDEDVAFVLAAIDRQADFDRAVLGPFHLRVLHRTGRVQWSECWAYQTPALLGFEGHLVTLTPESVADRLATAMRRIAAGDEITETLAGVAGSLGAHPVESAAAVLTVEHRRITGHAGPWPLAEPALDAIESPWAWVAAGGADVEVRRDDLPRPIADDAARAGYESVFVRAIDVGGIRRGVLVAWRRSAVAPTPNQLEHLRDAIDVARLAYSQDEHRTKLQQAAHRDHLTGVGNRAQLEVYVQQGIAPSGVLYIDLDGFKQVNDVHGHHVGDGVLRGVGDRLAGVIGAADRLYRIGGDEFVIVCGAGVGRVDAAPVEALARAVVEATREPLVVAGLALHVTASVGVAVNDGTTTVEQLIEQADWSLLSAKRSGKAQWQRRRLAALAG